MLGVTNLVMTDQKSIDAGAPEIEVTPEMIEDGREVLVEFGLDWDMWTPDFQSRLVSTIYERMIRAHRAHLSDPKPHSSPASG